MIIFISGTVIFAIISGDPNMIGLAIGAILGGLVDINPLT